MACELRFKWQRLERSRDKSVLLMNRTEIFETMIDFLMTGGEAGMTGEVEVEMIGLVEIMMIGEVEMTAEVEMIEEVETTVEVEMIEEVEITEVAEVVKKEMAAAEMTKEGQGPAADT